MLTLTVTGPGELRELAANLRRARGTLRSELTKAFKQSGNTTLRQVKRNMTTMPIRGYRAGGMPFREHRSGKGLRRRIAAVTELDVRTGSDTPRIRFVVHTGRLGSARRVPGYLDSGRPFRHPIMGNRRKWARSSGRPWFYKEIRRGLAGLRADCQHAIDTTIRSI